MLGLETGCQKTIKHLLVQMGVPHRNAAGPGAAPGLSPEQRSSRVWEEFPASSCKTSLSALNRASAKMPVKDRQGLRRWGRAGTVAGVPARWGCWTQEGWSHLRGAGPGRFPAGWSLLPQPEGQLWAPPSQPPPWIFSLFFFLNFFFLAASTALCKITPGAARHHLPRSWQLPPTYKLSPLRAPAPAAPHAPLPLG